MEQGSTDHRSRVRLHDRISGSALAKIVVAAGSFLIVALVAACGGGGGVQNQPAAQPFAPQAGTCNPVTMNANGTMRPLPVGPPNCSPPPQWQIIVANPGNNTATSYVFADNGNATPVATMSASANQLNGDYGIWFDGDTGDFFIANVNSNDVNRYPIGCLNGGSHTGSNCPDQSLSGTNTGLAAPYAATENYYNMLPQGDEPAYTLNKTTPSIVCQLENQAGNATPLFTIKGSNTHLADGQGLAVDGNSPGVSPNSGAIYADAYTAAKVYMWAQPSPWPAPGSVLNIAPTKTISGAATGITHPMGLYVDTSGYLYVVNRNPDKIIVFSPTATGNATPSNTITNAAIVSPYGVSVYTDGTVYETNDSSTPSLASFSNGEHGPSSLVHKIQGSATGLSTPANLDVRISR
jgi:hypothetical protein